MQLQEEKHGQRLTMEALDFQQERPHLFKLAYRMLGSVAEAEDVVQETWLRWQKRCEQAGPAAGDTLPASYLYRIVTNISIDHLRSRSRQLESYVGPWLPEPIVVSNNANAEQELEFRDTFSLGFLSMLEALNPNERAVFVLKEAFGSDHAEIAEIVDTTEANSRQLLKRGRNKLRDQGWPTAAQETASTPEQRRKQRNLIEKFIRALRDADTDQALKLLSNEALAISDGGGLVSAALVPLQGPDQIVKVLQYLARKTTGSNQLIWAEVNGQPGLLFYREDQLESVIAIEVSAAYIHRIFIQRNPTKLDHLTAVAPLARSS